MGWEDISKNNYADPRVRLADLSLRWAGSPSLTRLILQP